MAGFFASVVSALDALLGHFRRKAITRAVYACHAAENAPSGQSCMN
jgi:hypothetical protein